MVSAWSATTDNQPDVSAGTVRSRSARPRDLCAGAIEHPLRAKTEIDFPSSRSLFRELCMISRKLGPV